MLTAYNVADFFIDLAKYDENDTITNLRINKLLYFAQAWFMVRYNTPLFDDDFEAWDLGPVIPCIYKKYKNNGKNNIDTVSDGFSEDIFSEDELNTLIDVASYYGQFSTSSLVNITHKEGSPWAIAHKNGSDKLIEKSNIKSFFKHEEPLGRFVIPSSIYESSITPKRNEQGVLVLPKDFDDDDE